MKTTITTSASVVGVKVKHGCITLTAGDLNIVIHSGGGEYHLEEAIEDNIRFATTLIDQLTYGRDQLQKRLDRMQEQQ